MDNSGMSYDELVRHYGSMSEAARAIGLSRQTVHQWKRAGIPPVRQIQIEELTRGALRAEPLPELGRREERAQA
jgi:DNA-binding transcriptional regulator YdaS (Cro superfamily)